MALAAGGTTTSSSMTLESTTAAGVSDSLIFKTGSQATAMTIDTNGNVIAPVIVGSSVTNGTLTLESTLNNSSSTDKIIFKTGANATNMTLDGIGNLRVNAGVVAGIGGVGLGSFVWGTAGSGTTDAGILGDGLIMYSGSGIDDGAQFQMQSNSNGQIALLSGSSTVGTVPVILQMGGYANTNGGLYTAASSTETDSELADKSGLAPFGASLFRANACTIGSNVICGNGTALFNLNGSAAPTAATGVILQLVGANSASNIVENDTFAGAPIYTGRRADGTAASPTTVQSGDVLANFGARPFDGSAYASASTGSIQPMASENFTTGAHGTDIVLNCTAITTTTTAECARAKSSGFTIPTGSTYQINGTQISASNLSNGITGTAGSAVVLTTGPTIASLISSGTARIPVATGGTAASSTMTLESTTAAGTTDSIIFKTGSQVTALTLSTAQLATFAGQVNVSAMTQTSAAQSGTICYNSGTGAVTYDATLGCLASLEELKDIKGPISGALGEVMALHPFWYSWKKGTLEEKTDKAVQPGLGAHATEKVDKRLVGYGQDGKLRGVRYTQMVALLVASLQEQQGEISELRGELMASLRHGKGKRN